MSLVDLGKRLLDAAKKGDTEEVRALMSNGAPFTTDWLGTSPLHFSAQNGHLSTAEVLLRAGISRDARTKVDRTPLHVASQEGHITIVELLLRNGADIEAKDMLKMTPLHWSVEKGHIEVVDILVKNGADMNCENKFDKSPLDIAITNGRTDLVQILQLQQNPIVEVVTTEEDGVLETETVVTEAMSTGVTTTPVVISPQPVALVANQSYRAATESQDQSSTSVLATLAALAEATAPMNASSTTSTTAAEALSWLETHGITMISNSDASTAVTSSLEHPGQTLTLTEAGKLALNFVKSQNSEETETIEETVVDGTVEEHVQHVEIGNSGTQKVITIVAAQGELEGASGDGPVVVTMATEDVHTELEAESEGEPATKKLRVSDEGLSSENTSSDQEELRRQLEEVQKQAQEYKQQLMKKEQEAEVYKKQLNDMTNKSGVE